MLSSEMSKATRIRSWLNRRRWLVRLGLTFLLTSLVLTALLLLLVSRMISGQLVNKADAANRELLNQIYLTIDYTLSDLYTEYYQLWRNDPDIQTILNTDTSANTGLTTDLDASVSHRLNFNAEQTSMVHSVYLVSFRHDRVWSSLGSATSLASMSDRSAIEFLTEISANFNKYRRDVFFARRVVLKSPSGEESREVLTFFFIQRLPGGQFSDVLLVNLDREKFSSLIQLQADSGLIALVSPSGEIIADTTRSWAGSPISSLLTNQETFDNLIQSDQASGSMITSTTAGQSLLTWLKAETMGFVLLDLTPMTSVYRDTNKVNRLIAIYFAAAMLMSLIIGLWSVRILYRPLQQLLNRFKMPDRLSSQQELDEFAVLDSAFHQFELRENQSILQKLLSGTVPPDADRLFDHPIVCWIGLTIMPLQDSALDSEQMLQICAALQDRLGVSAIMTADDCVSALVGGREGDLSDPDVLRIRFEVILADLCEGCLAKLVAGIGAPVDQLADSRTTHRQSLIAANQARLISDEHSSITQRIQIYSEMGLIADTHKDNRPTVTSQIQSIVAEHLADPDLTIDQIAELIGLSTGYLRQLFKQETGQTISDYLVDARVQRACDLLMNTDQTAREIGLSVGYLDSRYFYTLFKKKVGMTTDQFRKKSRPN